VLEHSGPGVCERGLKVHPGKMAIIALLGRQHICNKMVPVKEPPSMKDIKDIEHKELIVVRDIQLCMHCHRDRRDDGRS